MPTARPQSSSVVDGKHKLGAKFSVTGTSHEVEGTGNGPISAFCAALASVGVDVRVLDYAEHALTEASMPKPPPTSRSRRAARSCGA